MADFADDFYFSDYGDGVDASAIDCVAQEAVAVLHGAVLDEEGVGMDIADELGGWSRASAPDEGAEDEESEDE